MGPRKVFLQFFVCWICLLFLGGSMVFAQEKDMLRTPNGLSFADIKGYEAWQVVAPSYRPDKKEVRYILGNNTLINAYKSGVPGNNKPFPDGSILVKIAYSEKPHPAFALALVPDVLQRIEFMVRDSARFKDTGGWGYARFVYEAKTNTFKPYGDSPSFASECYKCHLLVKDMDYVFTKYSTR